MAYNKIDLPDVEARWQEFKEKLDSVDALVRADNVYKISAVAKTNVRDVLYRAVQILESMPEESPLVETPLYSVEADPREFSIEQENDGYRVRGVSIERAAAMTYWRHFQSIRRFQRILEILGIDEALREAGVEEGDTVYIGDNELVWEE